MGVEKQHEPSLPPNICVVNATDAEGRVVARDAFPTQEEADARATELRSQGYTVEQSPLAIATPSDRGA